MATVASAGDAGANVVRRVSFLFCFCRNMWLPGSFCCSFADTSCQVAYLFRPSDDEDDDVDDDVGGKGKTAATPSRRGSRKHRRNHRDGEPAAAAGRSSPKKQRTCASDSAVSANALEAFPTLLQGRETPAAVALRQHLFATTWAELDGRIQVGP